VPRQLSLIATPRGPTSEATRAVARELRAIVDATLGGAAAR
jgi:hypothetical protein